MISLAAGARGAQGDQGEAAAVTWESDGSSVSGEKLWDSGDLDVRAWWLHEEGSEDELNYQVTEGTEEDVKLHHRDAIHKTHTAGNPTRQTTRLLQQSIAKDKEKDGGGKYGLKETKTYQPITMCVDLIWILSQTRCEKRKKKGHLTTRNVNAEWTFDEIKKMISS